MADTAAPAPAAPKPASPKKASPKKAAKPKVAPSHPTYKDMAVAAIAALKDRSGSSRQAILKYVMANYKVGTDATKVGKLLNLALKKGVASGALKPAAAAGRKGAGSYRIGEKPKVVKKKPAKKPAAKKAKTPKKAKATKSPAKKAAKKAPAKKAAKKPVAKKPKTPKKAAKSPVKKAVKAPAKKAVKAPAKKAVKRHQLRRPRRSNGLSNRPMRLTVFILYKPPTHLKIYIFIYIFALQRLK